MSIYDIKVKNGKGEEVSLESYRNKVLLVVNTATGCGFTPQYEGLENLYKEYHEQGLEILDFPCNQFGHQAPWNDEEIHQFCTTKYNTTFDQLSKIEVNWENQDPLYEYLKSEIKKDKINWLKDKATMAAVKKISSTCKNDGDIIWNFTKFIIDRNGQVVDRYSPIYNPSEMEDDLKNLI